VVFGGLCFLPWRLSFALRALHPCLPGWRRLLPFSFSAFFGVPPFLSLTRQPASIRRVVSYPALPDDVVEAFLSGVFLPPFFWLLTTVLPLTASDASFNRRVFNPPALRSFFFLFF